MAYLIYGEKYPVVFLANPRTGSTSIREALLEHGAEQHGQHHSTPDMIPKDALVVQTVRHHCDVLVSYWYKSASGHPFHKFVNMVLDGHHRWLRADGFYSRWGDIPNYILRYDTLDYEWANLCLCAGLPDIKLQRTHTKRPVGIKWNLLFTPDLYDKVATRYKDEMELYGYGRT